MKKGWKIVLCILLALVLVVGGYVAYVLIDYHRIGDQELAVQNGAAETSIAAGETYKIVSYNIGFGAYESDYGFFMDGGTESRAWSEERLTANLDRIARTLTDQNSDFYLVQEVDIDSTRIYHVDEREPLYAALSWENSVFCQNYDSPYLMYPLTKPHGASRSGLLTFAPAEITSARRVELPVESGFMKLLDLDRCYSVSRIPVDGGRELVLYNLHLSAYTSDGTIATEQLSLLLRDMQSEYEKGNWCVAGGDFNKDLLGNSPEIFGVAAGENDTWAQPIPEGTIPAGLTLVAPFDETAPTASCRTASEPYSIETTFRLTVDGFLVSDNVEVVDSAVLDAGFLYSDHNPVWMDFKLN